MKFNFRAPVSVRPVARQAVATAATTTTTIATTTTTAWKQTLFYWYTSEAAATVYLIPRPSHTHYLLSRRTKFSYQNNFISSNLLYKIETKCAFKLTYSIQPSNRTDQIKELIYFLLNWRTNSKVIITSLSTQNLKNISFCFFILHHLHLSKFWFFDKLANDLLKPWRLTTFGKK